MSTKKQIGLVLNSCQEHKNEGTLQITLDYADIGKMKLITNYNLLMCEEDTKDHLERLC